LVFLFGLHFSDSFTGFVLSGMAPEASSSRRDDRIGILQRWADHIEQLVGGTAVPASTVDTSLPARRRVKR
jgi:hypothetical protein